MTANRRIRYGTSPLGILILATGLVGATPEAGHAQSYLWNYLCYPTNLGACGGFSTQFTWNSLLNRTTINIGISNSQGTTPWLPDSGRYGILGLSVSNVRNVGSGPTGFGFIDLAPNGSFESGVALEGTGDLDGMYGAMTSVDGTLVTGLQHGGHGIWGCGGAPDAGSGSRLYTPFTCSGRIVFSTTVTGQWELSDNSAFSISAHDGQGGHFTCTTGIDCVTIATPEAGGPAAFLASGFVLFLLGGVRRAYRRR